MQEALEMDFEAAYLEIEVVLTVAQVERAPRRGQREQDHAAKQ